MVNSQWVKEVAAGLGADLCGMASVASFTEAPVGFHPTDIYAECQSVIVLACQFPLSSLQGNSMIPYTQVRNSMVVKMDLLAFEMSAKLEQAGLIAMPVPSTDPYEYWDAEKTHGRGILSLKHAAVLAGLGAIGKNTLLVNSKYGNMIWLSAVLVDALLEPDPFATYNLCPEKCQICLDSCPVQALDGITINQSLCRGHSNANSTGGGWYLTCNLCRRRCPNFSGL